MLRLCCFILEKFRNICFNLYKSILIYNRENLDFVGFSKVLKFEVLALNINERLQQEKVRKR